MRVEPGHRGRERVRVEREERLKSFNKNRLVLAIWCCAGASGESLPRAPSPRARNHMRRALLALGGNQGDVPSTLATALRSLAATGVHVAATSRLFDTAPAHVTDQPRFLNAVVAVTTELEPGALLDAVKRVEESAGRGDVASSQRYGPRPLDVDVIAIDGFSGAFVSSATGRELTLPHTRWRERRFVTAPLADLARRGASGPPPTHSTDVDAVLAAALAAEKEATAADVAAEVERAARGGGGDDDDAPPSLDPIHPVVPLPRAGLWRVGSPGDVGIMAVLNVTPDSFSDGGALVSGAAANLDAVLAAALTAVTQGATLLDVGGQSTRPWAVSVSAEVEASRVVPAVRALASHPALASIPISVDTFHASVAEAALQAGADIINDVSCGRDPCLAATTARHGGAYILMHSRGSLDAVARGRTTYEGGVMAGVAEEVAAAAARITVGGAGATSTPSHPLLPHWSLLLDPGLGFAKTGPQNVELLSQLPALRSHLPPPLAALPLLLGPSRKRFLGAITGRPIAADRDIATAGAVALAAGGGAGVVRVHGVGATRDAARVGGAAWAAAVAGGRAGG